MAAGYIKTGGVWTSIGAVWVKTAGVWTAAGAVWQKISGVWTPIYTSLEATVPPNVSTSGSTATLTTTNATCTQLGGIGPYTFLWTKTGGDAINALVPANQTTSFQATGMIPGEIRTATFICTVTDTTTGLDAPSNTLTVDIERFI